MYGPFPVCKESLEVVCSNDMIALSLYLSVMRKVCPIRKYINEQSKIINLELNRAEEQRNWPDLLVFKEVGIISHHLHAF